MGDNGQKNNVLHRLINSTFKSRERKKEVQSKPAARKFQYQLPKTFFEAVDDARLKAGYDVLPHFHHLSVSPSSSSSTHQSKKQHHNHHQTGHKYAQSLTSSDNNNVSPKKVRRRNSTRKHSHHHHHHHHHQKEVDQSSPASSSPRTTSSNASLRSLNTTKISSSVRSSDD